MFDVDPSVLVMFDVDPSVLVMFDLAIYTLESSSMYN